MAQNVGQFLFFDQDSTTLESNVYGIGAVGGSSLTIQVIADESIETISDNIRVLGSVDMTEEHFNELKAINLKTFKSSVYLQKPEIYFVITSGVNYIKIKRDSITSPIKIFAIAVS